MNESFKFTKIYCLFSARTLLAILLVFYGCAAVKAQSKIILEKGKNNVILNEKELHWFTDTFGVWKYAQIKQLPENAFASKHIEKLDAKWHYWSHFSISNQNGIDKEYIFQIPKTGYADLWIQSDSGSVHLQTGSLLPLNQRSYPSSINAFHFIVHNNETVHLYLRLHKKFSLYFNQNSFFKISELSAFEKSDTQRVLWQALFCGVILVMALYNFFIFLSVKDTSYLYYVLSIISIGSYFAFYYGFGIEYIYPNWPLWDVFSAVIINPFTGIARILFTKTYLHTSAFMPRINKLLNLLLVACSMVLAAGFISFIFQLNWIQLLGDCIGITGTLVLIMMVIAGMQAYYNKKYMPAKFFIIANVLLVIGAIAFIGRELNLINENFLTRYLVQIGVLVQTVVFSLGLSHRLNEMRIQLSNELLEKERLALEKEREKKQLIEQQKKELHLEVQQQTASLKRKNIQLKETIAQLKESKEQLTQLNEVKNKLFSIISHDLRNPLATMQSFMKLLTEHHNKLTAEEKQKIFIEAQQSLDNLNQLLYNLLEWSKSQMNLLQFKPEKLNVQMAIEHSIRLLKLHAHMKQITIITEFNEQLTAYADVQMTEVIIRNLLGNAIKFSPRNSKVIVKAYEQDNEIHICVEDEGIGMNENKLHNLLELKPAFSRKGTEKEKGSGLGLLICKEFIQKNKGAFSIHSEAGKGSSFKFTLPLYKKNILIQPAT